MTQRGLSAQLRTIGSLDARDRTAWLRFRDADPALASPYFALEFAETLAAVRDDTRILVLSRDGTPAGYLPLHVPRSGIARPIAGPMGDHHGLITDDPGLALDAALSEQSFGLFAYHGALANQTAFRNFAREAATPSWYADLGAGYDAYLADLADADAKAMRNLRARQRKLDALGDRVVFRADDRRREALDALLTLKRGQYRATGAMDIFKAGWTNALIDRLFADRTAALGGVLSTLEIDGQLAAGHFGMRSQSVLHYWFPAYDPAFSGYGPGLALFLRLAEALSDDGIRQIHLGPGDYDFKKRLSNRHFDVVQGQIGQASLVNAWVSGLQLADRMARALPLGRASYWPGKALRRIDNWTALRAV